MTTKEFKPFHVITFLLFQYKTKRSEMAYKFDDKGIKEGIFV